MVLGEVFCMDHNTCGRGEFCYGGNCDVCKECHHCEDGIDGTCGNCGPGFPSHEPSDTICVGK